MGLGVEVEAGEVGFDAARLARIDRHFARYVEDGRLPGWLVLASRRGKIVHLATRGLRDLEAGLPVEADTRFRIYSMTKPVTAAAAMQLYEEGRSPSRTRWRGSSPPSPSWPSTATARPRSPHRARDPADAAVAPAHPHRRPHLRVPLCPPGRRHVPGGRFEWVAPKAATWPSAASSGPGCRCCSSRAASGTTRSPATCSAGWSRWSAASRWTGSWKSGSSGRWACATPGSGSR